MILGIVEIDLYGVCGKLSRTICPTLWGISQMVKAQLCKSFIIGPIPISPSKIKGYLNW